MSHSRFGNRRKKIVDLHDFSNALQLARQDYQRANYLESLDIYEQLVTTYPAQSIPLLAEVYEIYQQLPQKDRYNLYQARFFEFGIQPTDKVLDVGSGHLPFPFATHLTDITLENHQYGRAGIPFKHVAGKPVFECNIEHLPFGDQEFDFVYCSHVLEHADNPEKACQELMRVGKRGFIETPTKGKDIFLNTAKLSNHRWAVDYFDQTLVFFEYTPEEIEGLQHGILLQMHLGPETLREKAFSALLYLKANQINTMFLWEQSFNYEVRRISGPSQVIAPAQIDPISSPTVQQSQSRPALKFMQVHNFYEAYLHNFYTRRPTLAAQSFQEQITALVQDGFAAIHIFAPYMQQVGYQTSQLVIANCAPAQSQWLREHHRTINNPEQWLYEVVRQQIETFEPDVLYLTDPITFDSHFIRSLPKKPRLIMGWRASVIPAGVDWSEFDIILSNLTALRTMAVQLGAKSAESFFPGFPEQFLSALVNTPTGSIDVVFPGSIMLPVHTQRLIYLQKVAQAANSPGQGFSCAFYLSANPQSLPPEVAHYQQGARWGLEMYRTLRSGKIVLDIRGDIGFVDPATQTTVDLARRETANMRIFEATGCGAFLLAEHHENLQDYFEIGREIETFRNEQELIEKIRYYLAHPKEREAIARRGQQRCLSQYSTLKRAQELDSLVQKFLSSNNLSSMSKLSSSSTTIQSVPSYSPPSNSPSQQNSFLSTDFMQRAQQALIANNFDTALNLLSQAKALKQPTLNLDTLRAMCFLKLNQVGAAWQALLEELRFFPDNQEAKNWLQQIETQVPQLKIGQIQDPEFQDLFKLIRPHTMLSEARLYSLFSLVKRICVENLPGNVVECGVAGGGSTALMALVIKRYSQQPRWLYAFDSFEGLPAPTTIDKHEGAPAESTGWGTGTCAGSEEHLRNLCTQLGIVDVVKPIKGYFQDSLPRMRNWVGMIALLHLDGDWYESTQVILQQFYDRIVNGGILQIDDYGYWEGCRRAVHEFETTRSLKFDLKPIDDTGVWCVKPDQFPVNPVLERSLISEFSQDDPMSLGIQSQMSQNERFQLYYAVRKELRISTDKPVRFIEIGSFAGASLLLTCRAFHRITPYFQGFAIEPNRHPQLMQLVPQLKPQVTHLPMLSQQALPQLQQQFEQDGNFPVFIFVDGDHSYEGVWQDAIDYFQLLAPGGLMVFHDCLPALNAENREAILFHHGGQEPGVRRAFEELVECTYGEVVELPLLFPSDPTQTQAYLPIIPGVFSTLRAYRKGME